MQCSTLSTRKQIQKMQGHTGLEVLLLLPIQCSSTNTLSEGHVLGFKSSLLFSFWPYTFTYKAVQLQAASVSIQHPYDFYLP